MKDRVERIESIKAGSLSGMAASITYGTIFGIDRFLSSGHLPALTSFALEVAIAAAGGFLFGITYRYIIRTDRNDHLNSGAVLAFGLVRGLAKVNIDEFDLAGVESNGVILIENILLFTIARYLLDYALVAQWISPFKGSEEV
jgi:hypothetical protein